MRKTTMRATEGAGPGVTTRREGGGGGMRVWRVALDVRAATKWMKGGGGEMSMCMSGFVVRETELGAVLSILYSINQRLSEVLTHSLYLYTHAGAGQGEATHIPQHTAQHSTTTTGDSKPFGAHAGTVARTAHCTLLLH